MANEGMPTNKELIAWARKRAGLSEFNICSPSFMIASELAVTYSGRGC